MQTNKINIQRVTQKDLPGILEYVKDFRAQLFPMLDPLNVPFDLKDFSAYYLESTTGAFLKASLEDGTIIGAIGMMPYKDRFTYLDYSGRVCVEVARLFIEPEYRRKHFAQELVQSLIELAKKNGVEVLYLHTHPFLPGAVEFWHKQGFTTIKKSQEGNFTTIHMELEL